MEGTKAVQLLRERSLENIPEIDRVTEAIKNAIVADRSASEQVLTCLGADDDNWGKVLDRESKRAKAVVIKRAAEVALAMTAYSEETETAYAAVDSLLKEAKMTHEEARISKGRLKMGLKNARILGARELWHQAEDTSLNPGARQSAILALRKGFEDGLFTRGMLPRASFLKLADWIQAVENGQLGKPISAIMKDRQIAREAAVSLSNRKQGQGQPKLPFRPKTDRRRWHPDQSRKAA